MPPISWNVVCFASVDWDYSRQRPQWVASELAARGARVLYVDNLGLRMPRASDLPRLARRLRGWARTTGGRTAEVAPGVRRDSPIVPPPLHVKPLRDVATAMLTRRLRARIGDRRPLVVWTYLPAPAIADVARAVGADLLVYDWSDDAASHLLTRSERHRRRVAAWEDAMLAGAGVVFVASEELLRRRPSPNPHTFVVPHGVATFAADAAPPAAVAAAPRPRVGFVGTLSQWVDVELLAGLADARRDWTLVLLGPVRTRADALLGRANVVGLGPRPHEDVAGTLAALDVALIPYRRVPAIEAASPVKLHEYLAVGLPVVSADLPEVRPHSPPVRIAEGVEGFRRAIEEALADGRREPVRGPGWDRRVDEMIAHAERALSGARP